ncbi:hypothetical protein TG4357_03063 [Thalassovita gelatinovora]|uniref:Uncharacterized protein n=1 Tax=Thalassovita gelatinovora TaxID=53501 RepID=A0A0P1G7B2_THAGE|nr:hypothetical protein [Thalassovita gelatinovora]QIZ82042.1 hypothetical protein HFZ77_16935 [Thalassovita gelatinovora]CUH67532.1 hypothetical protein TG4357_03063 [Thalassovita gelatinovora]SEP72272.1 hypothetical protein SAMN04488043_101197 [Thalassovita gelatinovora]
MVKTAFLRKFSVIAVAAAGVIILAEAAQADGTVVPKQPTLKHAKSEAGAGKTHFDWLAKSGANDANASRKTVRQASLGRGSWICSAAGFGKKSRCYHR